MSLISFEQSGKGAKVGPKWGQKTTDQVMEDKPLWDKHLWQPHHHQFA